MHQLNPFTAPACKISRLKDAWTCLQTVYFPVLQHICFECWAFWLNLFHMPIQKIKQICLRVSNFTLLSIVLRWHHGSERVKLSCLAKLMGRTLAVVSMAPCIMCTFGSTLFDWKLIYWNRWVSAQCKLIYWNKWVSAQWKLMYWNKWVSVTNPRGSLLFQVSKLLTVNCCVAAWIAELRHSPPWCQGMLWSGSCWAVLLDRCLPPGFISEIHWSLLWTTVWWWRQFMESVQGLNPVPSAHMSMCLKSPVKEKFRQSSKRKV